MSSTTDNKPDGPLFGVLAEYAGPDEIVSAARRVRDAGYTKWDCYSPFPVPGLDQAMAIKRTKLPLVIFLGGLTGLAGGLGLQWWANTYHWPTAWIVSGKPFFSIPANIPITFESTVLLSALTAFFGLWIANKLPQVFHPFFRNDRFIKASNDGFLIGIEASDPKFEQERTTRLLEEAGATAVEACHRDPDPVQKKIPRGIFAFIALTTALAIIPVVCVARARATKSTKPHWHIMPDMDFQPKHKAQDRSSVFADQRASRPPIAGTVAQTSPVGDFDDDDHLHRGIVSIDGKPAWSTTFPGQLPITPETMERGRERYDIYCSPCHGLSGYGDGMINSRGQRGGGTWVQPTSLHSAPVVIAPHGQLFNVISHGSVSKKMKGYAAQIPPRDRWAIVLYLRALQRSQNASQGDVQPGARPGVVP